MFVDHGGCRFEPLNDGLSDLYDVVSREENANEIIVFQFDFSITWQPMLNAGGLQLYALLLETIYNFSGDDGPSLSEHFVPWQTGVRV